MVAVLAMQLVKEARVCAWVGGTFRDTTCANFSTCSLAGYLLPQTECEDRMVAVRAKLKKSNNDENRDRKWENSRINFRKTALPMS